MKYKLNLMYDKFQSFLENISNKDNESVINAIKDGYELIFESLSTDDANFKKDGQAIPITGTGMSHSGIDIYKNRDNEYFNKTLSDKLLKKVDKSQLGNKAWINPPSGRWTLSNDPMSSGHGTQPNANIDSGEYAGDSGGYNIGGPV
jgi:hypothetical protein